MAYFYFYLYLILVLAAFALFTHYRKVKLRHILIGVATAAYSISFDIIFGDWMGLYHYLDPNNSTLYIVLSGIFIYAPLNMLYLHFLPEARRKFLPYTACWVAGLFLFEYLTIAQNILHFTGWKPIPFSLATYAFAYLWINLLDRYLQRTLQTR